MFSVRTSLLCQSLVIQNSSVYMSIRIQGRKKVTGLGLGTLLAYRMHRIGCHSLHLHLNLDNTVVLCMKIQENISCSFAISFILLYDLIHVVRQYPMLIS
ncbi:hypothetical protein OCU04_006935 [Sclerotinia nivalis]|uniref:Uncharacterized protein n=1 Tax=Sclerotinia nivalis TaxID=352851 RepID=A0A9X0DK58_9HELO|nr:hypothetical protein OCU04_006935 [Sclerotinia nivalis]